MRTMVTLACTECKRRNYTTKKNKQNSLIDIELKKYCRRNAGANTAPKKLDSFEDYLQA